MENTVLETDVPEETLREILRSAEHAQKDGRDYVVTVPDESLDDQPVIFKIHIAGRSVRAEKGATGLAMSFLDNYGVRYIKHRTNNSPPAA